MEESNKKKVSPSIRKYQFIAVIVAIGLKLDYFICYYQECNKVGRAITLTIESICAFLVCAFILVIFCHIKYSKVNPLIEVFEP